MINTKRFNLNTVFLLIFLLFPFIQQRTYGDLPHPIQEYVKSFYKYYTMFASTLIYVVALKYRGLLKGQRKFLTLILLFWAIYILSTLINYPIALITLFFKAYIHIALVLLVMIGCKKWCNEFVTAASFVYGCWIWMTLLTSFLFPDGLYRTSSYHSTHLLGDDNALAYVMLPGLVVMCINSIIKKGKIDGFTWITILMVVLLLTYLWAASGMISVILFFFLLIIIRTKHKFKAKWLLIVLIFTIFITLFGLSNPYVVNVIENYIKKDATLSGRTFLWDGALNMISKKPILGYGGFFQNGSFQLGEDLEYPCHTPYLQLMIDGGVALFVVFVILVSSVFRFVDKTKENKLAMVMAAGLFCMLLNYITEHSQLLHFFIIITMMFNVDYLKKNDFKTRTRER